MEKYRQWFGRWAEEVVCRHLSRQGYLIVDRHWFCRAGEIDIIAFDTATQCLVFVEVRAKTSKACGRPEESIGWRKKCSLARSISYYVLVKNHRGQYRCDICALEKTDGRRIKLLHLKNVRLD